MGGNMRYRAFSFCLACCTLLPAVALALEPQKFKTLFDELDADTFATREAAQAALIKAAETSGGLTVGQVLTLQRTAVRRPNGNGVPSLEQATRAGRVFDTIVQKSPSAAAIIANLGVQADGSSGVFTFGAATGRYDLKDRAAAQAFLVLQRHWDALAFGLEKGDVKQAISAYDAINSEVKKLGDAGLKKLNLKLNGNDFTVNDFGTLINQVLDPAFGKLPDDLKKIGANPNAGAMRPIPVDNAGATQLGLSVGLDIGQLLVRGGLNLTDVPPDLARSLPPPGYEDVGHIYDIRATDGLVVDGRIDVDIDYGDLQLIGNPITDPADLRILRYADGTSTFLTPDPSETSIGMDSIGGYYDISSLGSDRDQFGEFLLVEPIAEPGALVLFATFIVLLWLIPKTGKG
jgi:hypothetical protein